MMTMMMVVVVVKKRRMMMVTVMRMNVVILVLSVPWNPLCLQSLIREEKQHVFLLPAQGALSWLRQQSSCIYRILSSIV